jgi:hypothetical protein
MLQRVAVVEEGLLCCCALHSIVRAGAVSSTFASPSCAHGSSSGVCVAETDKSLLSSCELPSTEDAKPSDGSLSIAGALSGRTGSLVAGDRPGLNWLKGSTLKQPSEDTVWP